MKEIVKNKAMISFILFMVGVAYINSIQMGEVVDLESKDNYEIAMKQN